MVLVNLVSVNFCVVGSMSEGIVCFVFSLFIIMGVLLWFFLLNIKIVSVFVVLVLVILLIKLYVFWLIKVMVFLKVELFV